MNPQCDAYEMVIGLETHVELRTLSKAFCACANRFGAPPNTLVCPVCMGLPGALPVFNRQALRLAATAGLALHCKVHRKSGFDRKHYFYLDLPKAYQITQWFHPLCENGQLMIETRTGAKRVGITRIHMEEDAGKLLHDERHGTLLDLNRCGVPLIEIVSGPDIRSAEEATLYLRKLRAILSFAGVSDCKMNEGSLRCDVNLSVRKAGDPLGVRTEIKNLNSFQSVERAIAAEYERQAALLHSGEPIRQETRRYDARTGQTFPMRKKETSADYRYFPDPDLPDLLLTEEEFQEIRNTIPPLPDERREQYMQKFGLTSYASEQLSTQRWLAEYFERAAERAKNPVALCNLIVGEVFALITLRESVHTGERDERSLPIAPDHLARLSDLMADGRINSSTAKKILAALFERDEDPEAYAARHDLFMLTDPALLREVARHVLSQNASMTAAYHAGKTNVEKALMGKAMAETKGRADPERLREILLQELVFENGSACDEARQWERLEGNP